MITSHWEPETIPPFALPTANCQLFEFLRHFEEEKVTNQGTPHRRERVPSLLSIIPAYHQHQQTATTITTVGE